MSEYQKSIVEKLDDEAANIARIYSLSFPATFVAIILITLYFLAHTAFSPPVIILTGLGGLLATYLYFCYASKTWNLSDFYGGFYERERKRVYKRYLGQKKYEKKTRGYKKRRKIFIVHGHDEAVLQGVARFVEQLELLPIIIKEMASGGNTIIEKLEEYSDVDYALVLMTPDDFGGVAKNPEESQPRARQNVIAELGYMIGKLKRHNVCILSRGVEIPSDFHGVVSIELEKDWKLGLAQELKNAGVEADLNKLINSGEDEPHPNNLI